MSIDLDDRELDDLGARAAAALRQRVADAVDTERALATARLGVARPTSRRPARRRPSPRLLVLTGLAAAAVLLAVIVLVARQGEGGTPQRITPVTTPPKLPEQPAFGETLTEFRVGGPVLDVGLSADGSRVLVTEGSASGMDQTTSWDAASGERVAELGRWAPGLEVPTRPATFVAASDDGRTYRLVDVDTGRLIGEVPVGTADDLSSDGSQLLVWRDRLETYDTATGRLVGTMPIPPGTLSASVEGELVTSDSEKTSFYPIGRFDEVVWPTTELDGAAQLPHAPAVRTNGDGVALTHMPELRLGGAGIGGIVNAVELGVTGTDSTDFTPSGSEVVDGRQLIDVRSGRRLTTIPGWADGPSLPTDWIDDQSQVMVLHGYSDGQHVVTLEDVRSGSPLGELLRLPGPPVIGGSADAPNLVVSTAVDAGGHRAAIATHDGRIRIMSITPSPGTPRASLEPLGPSFDELGSACGMSAVCATQPGTYRWTDSRNTTLDFVLPPGWQIVDHHGDVVSLRPIGTTDASPASSVDLDSERAPEGSDAESSAASITACDGIEVDQSSFTRFGSLGGWRLEYRLTADWADHPCVDQWLLGGYGCTGTFSRPENGSWCSERSSVLLLVDLGDGRVLRIHAAQQPEELTTWLAPVEQIVEAVRVEP